MHYNQDGTHKRAMELDIEPIVVSAKPSKDPRGRMDRDPRKVLNGILWILQTGAPWKDISQGIRHTTPVTGVSSNGLNREFSARKAK
jgi:transposase